MKSENFFEKIGKKLPYQVPEDFFDSITERTLQNAIKRNRRAKKRYMVIWTSAAAVILVLLTISVIYNYQFNIIGIEKTLVQTEEKGSVKIPRKKMEPISDSSMYDDMNVVEKKQVPFLEENSLNEEETFKDLLATLTDDELLTLAGQISAEISINSLIEE